MIKVKNIATVAATGALLLNMALPAFAATVNLEVSGNGSDSDNEISFDRDTESGVYQQNESKIHNDISVSSNTGGNTADDNTGGNVKVKTGDTQVVASVMNQTGVNMAEVEACDCDSDTTVKVAGNGSDSDNEVDVELEHAYTVVQDNKAHIGNDVKVKADSGNNDADDNTGGSVKIDTGNVWINPVQIANLAGVNQARIGGTGQGDSSLALKIAGNGSDSDNEIKVENDKEVGIYQENGTHIYNDLYLDGNSGDNSASDNTGTPLSDPSITTGNVVIKAFVDNAAGFNVAEADCGCVLDVAGSILGNGTDSDSDIKLELDDAQEVTQDNWDFLATEGDVKADTGNNDADDNTSGQVVVNTGESLTWVEASNVGGTNLFGDVEFQLPFGWSFVLGL